MGSWLVIAEWAKVGGKWVILKIKTGKIDGRILKEDTWYQLKNGEFIEVK